MANSGNLYAKGVVALLDGNIKLTSDNIKLALVGSGYTPNLATDQYWSTPQVNEITTAGYTAGGSTLTGVSVTATTAASWTISYPASGTPVSAGYLIKSGNYLYRAANSGTAAAAAPTFPTVEGETVADGNGVIWTNLGTAVVVFTATGGYSWASISTSGVPYGVIYDSTPGLAASDPLIALLTFSPTLTNSPAGPVTINPDPALGYFAIPLF